MQFDRHQIILKTKKMNKELRSFLLKWLVFTFLLFGVHFYILYTVASEMELYLPLWSVYLFNSVLGFVVYFFVKRQFERASEKTYQTFLVLTLIKMGLALVFLLPLFLGKSNHVKVETINFFAPYFAFLAFEIFSLNKFFQAPKTK